MSRKKSPPCYPPKDRRIVPTESLNQIIGRECLALQSNSPAFEALAGERSPTRLQLHRNRLVASYLVHQRQDPETRKDVSILFKPGLWKNETIKASAVGRSSIHVFLGVLHNY
jgi:hypothetical protein